MTAHSIGQIGLGEVVGQLTVKITGRRRFAVRSWIAVRAFKLGALILGSKVEISLSD